MLAPETDRPDLDTERGDGPVGLLIGASVFLLGSVLAVYLALGYYASQVLEAAAQEGALFGAGFGGDAEIGSAHANGLIADSAGSLLEAWTVDSSVELDGGGRARLVVLIKADVVGPIGTWPVTATGSAPIEEFVPQTARTGLPAVGINS